MTETEDYDKSAIPTSHHATHEDGGSDEIDALGLIFPTALRVYLGTNQSIDPDTFSLLQFDTALFDKNSDYNLATHIFTAPSAGKYLATFICRLANMSAGDQTDYNIVSSSGDTISFVNTVGADGNINQLVLSIFDLAQSDTIQFKIKHSNALARNAVSGSAYTTASLIRLY